MCWWLSARRRGNTPARWPASWASARCSSNAPHIPLNQGVLTPVRIVLPECMLNPPRGASPADCAAVVGGNVETSQRVVDVILGALGVAAASQGTMNNLLFGDATFGYYETICGGAGATADAAGADAVHTHMTNTRITDPEVVERRYPVRVLEFSGSSGFRCERGKTAAGVPPLGGISGSIPPKGGTPARSPVQFAPKTGRANFPFAAGPAAKDGGAGATARSAVCSSFVRWRSRFFPSAAARTVPSAWRAERPERSAETRSSGRMGRWKSSPAWPNVRPWPATCLCWRPRAAVGGGRPP